MADPRDIEEAFHAHCTELVVLACLVDAGRPRTADLDFHRNNAVIKAVSRCMGTGEALNKLIAPHAQAGAWRRTVQAFHRERRARQATATEGPPTRVEQTNHEP
jgi:hypothetical protein